MAEIWTVGHSNHPLDAFLELLRSQNIGALADVRRFPGSRRYPHFNREALANSLQDLGMTYKHFPDLGGRRKVTPNSPNNAWRNAAFRGYADHMLSSEFQTAIQELLRLADQHRTAIMCAEALWWQCHRALISDFLKANGHRVLHILSPNKLEEHPFTSAAQILNGKLSYAVKSNPDLEFHF